MIVQSEVSLYPLMTESLSEGIDTFLHHFKGRLLEVRTGAMSTVIVGELTETFEAMAEAFASVAKLCPAVLVVKVSNACPRESAPEKAEYLADGGGTGQCPPS